MTGKYYSIALILFFVANLTAQWDTTLLRLDVLDPDKSVLSDGQLKTNIVSGFRIPVEPNDLPFTIFIITQDEIILNGYTTIVDAIAGLPGIRVSQPGSGEDGETFMMNGLYGNTYAKILINGVPVKPFMLRAFPIGAQLPIRNVERIEVFYGAASSLHGSDASAGVINIVTKENTKPNFVQANYTIGEGAYQNINVMYQTDINILGGKFGFSLYGNATQADRWQVNYKNIKFEPYEIDDLYRSSPNYSEEDDKPIVNEFPHASRLFGLELKYRKLKYESQLMYRREHSSLGLNPTAVSYDKPLSFIGERINNMRLSFRDQWGPIEVFSSANILDYNMDKNSSIAYLAPSKLYLDARFFEYIESGGLPSDSIRISLLENEFAGGIFKHASSTELNVEQGIQYKSQKGHYLNLVGRYETGRSVPFINKLTGILSFINPGEVIQEEDIYGNFTGFVQAYLNFNRIKLLFDSNFGDFIKTENTREELNSTYRLAASYLLNKNLKIRSSVSSSFKIPTINHIIESIFLDFEVDGDLFPTESLTYFNLGLNWQISKGSILDVSYYSYGINRHLIYSSFDDSENDLLNGKFRFHYGFTPETATFKDINGIQVFFRSQQFIKDIGFNFDLSLDYSWGQERYDRVLDFKGIGNGSSGEISGVRGVPQVMAKLNLNSKLSRDFYFRVQTTYYGKGVPFSMLSYLRSNQELETRSGVILNTAIRYQINRYFAIHGQIFNLLNMETSGIDANETLDVLDYNPQRQRSFRLGLDYIIR